MPSNVIDAAYMTAHEYPGGATALAVRLGVNAAVLSNRLNPNNNDHHLYVRDLMAIMTISGDHRALHAACLELGYTAMPLPDSSSKQTTSEALTSTCKEFSDYLQSVSGALADNKVTAIELRCVRQHLGEMVAAAGNLESILEAIEQKAIRP